MPGDARLSKFLMEAIYDGCPLSVRMFHNIALRGVWHMGIKPGFLAAEMTGFRTAKNAAR